MREFPRFSPVNLWFDYPIHKVDSVGVLKDLTGEEGFTAKGSPWKKNFSAKKDPEERKNDKIKSFETAFDCCQNEGKATVKELAEYMGVSEKTVRRHAKEAENYWIEDNLIGNK